ncbi:hypothetical protein [Streptomyces sp. NPDC003077]|uniref:hypothetical protein n=1 Tax=Streptomyces sp. NPDC003077 TaxID=3154443 RepID=UPI0033AB4510
MPYLVLKLVWVLGFDIGVVDFKGVGRGTWVAANVVTFLMDAVAALVALTLTRPRGRRAPAWLLLFPLWMASGLLLPLMVGVPAGTLAAFATGGDNRLFTGEFLEPWVFVVVYGGFIVEGLTLLGAFAVYAHQRWGALLRQPVGAFPDLGTLAVRRVLGTPAVALMAVMGVIRLLLGLGVPMGEAMGDNIVQRAGAVVQGALSVAGAAGATVLLWPRLGRGGRTRMRGPLALAWTGSAAAFAWGGTLWLTWSVVTAFTGGSSSFPGGLPGLMGSSDLIVGLVLLCLGACTLAGQNASVRSARSGHAEECTRTDDR